MTPEQERAKRKAERQNHRTYEEEKFTPAKCIACNGRGWALDGRFPTKIVCWNCNGSGRKE